MEKLKVLIVDAKTVNSVSRKPLLNYSLKVPPMLLNLDSLCIPQMVDLY